MNKETKTFKKVIKRRKISKGHDIAIKEAQKTIINKKTGKLAINQKNRKLKKQIKRANRQK
jgi:hypothetical protein